MYIICIYLLLGAFTSTLGQIHIGLLQHNVGIATTHTLDGSHGNANFALAIDVRIHDTKNVLELLWDDERLQKQMIYYKSNHWHRNTKA